MLILLFIIIYINYSIPSHHNNNNQTHNNKKMSSYKFPSKPIPQNPPNKAHSSSHNFPNPTNYLNQMLSSYISKSSSSISPSTKQNHHHYHSPYLSPDILKKSNNKNLPSILPQYHKNQQHNKIIQQYLLYNLSDPLTKTLQQGVVFIQYLTDQLYIGQISSPPLIPTSPPNPQYTTCKQGKGIYQYSNNDLYLGDWHEDNFNGLGMYIFANGDVYQGLFKNGNNIKGKFVSANGEQYTGEFRDGFRHGIGTMKYKSNQLNNNGISLQSQYTGQWQRGKKHGKGTYKQPNLTITGLWQQDTPNGEVIITTPNIQYHGIMSTNQLIKGHLKIHYPNNSLYHGQIYKNNYQGSGCFQNNSSKYSGQFKSGNIISGYEYHIWNKSTCANFGTMYQGQLSQKGLPHGNGKMVYANNDVYEGQWNYGVKQGQGCYKYGNGDQYEGGFHLDRIDGHGKYMWKNGVAAIGEFKSGVLVKQNYGMRGNCNSNSVQKSSTPSHYASQKWIKAHHPTQINKSLGHSLSISPRSSIRNAHSTVAINYKNHPQNTKIYSNYPSNSSGFYQNPLKRLPSNQKILMTVVNTNGNINITVPS